MKRTALAAALALLLAGTAQAAVTEFTIFKQPNFQGPSQTIKGEVANLEGGFARETSSIIARGGFWEVCTEDHFKGRCHVVEPGEHPTLGRRLDERIVSVRFLGTDQKFARRAQEERLALREDRREAREERAWRQAQGAIDLYGRPEFRGRSVRVEGTTPDLSEQRFDGRASSAIVHEGTWQACTEPGFRGQCAVLRPGEYPHLAQLDDRVSSLRQLR